MSKLIRTQELDTPLGTRLPVAWLNLEGRTEVAVPLARLAEVVGYELEPLRALIKRDPVLISFHTIVTMVRDGIPHKTAFLQRPGVLGALAKLSTARIKDPARRARVVAFQRWAFETLDRLLFEGAAPAQAPLFTPAPQTAPAAPRGDRQLAARLLVGEVLGPGGRLYTYSEIARLSGTPKTTLYRLAGRLGVAHLRTHHPQPELRRTPELARILAQQAEILSLIARRLS